MSLLRKPFPYSVEQRINPYPNGEDADYGTWEKALDVGRSYLVGATVPLSEFQRIDTSSLNEWRSMAFEWCVANPSRMVLASTKPRWIACRRHAAAGELITPVLLEGVLTPLPIYG
jgi:hypothetical protein